MREREYKRKKIPLRVKEEYERKENSEDTRVGLFTQYELKKKSGKGKRKRTIKKGREKETRVREHDSAHS